MLDSMLDAAFARGATVVTPNKRLARELSEAYDGIQLAAGRSSWPSARALPWSTFVAGLVDAAQDAGLPLPAHRFDAAQATQLWHRVVATDPARSPLIDLDATASLAAEAWERMHAFGNGAESLRGWSYPVPDVEAFVGWAERYRRELQRLDALDDAQSANVVATVARDLPKVAGTEIVLAGFIDLSPQQQRLIDALCGAGACIARQPLTPPPIGESSARLAISATPREEIARALDFARERVRNHPNARVGVVVLDLARRRESVRAACEERLCAPLQWPGCEDLPRPYDISLGVALADVPLVASALALIAIAEQPIDRSRAAVLIRSPYLPGSDTGWMRRAALERTWIERGAREIGWGALISDFARIDATLAECWQSSRSKLADQARLSPRAWAERWGGWISDVGWCEGRTLSSNEYQAHRAWNELLATFAQLAAVSPLLSRDDALTTLHRLARERVFQPAASDARIRVLGLLEATGLSFDALWVAGVASDAWPRPPEPNPMLPIAWQRERKVPRSSAEHELAFARKVSAALAHAAPEVVFSYAIANDEQRRTASPLLAALPTIESGPLPPSTAERMFVQRPALQSIADLQAPPLPLGTALPGGTKLIEAQSDCPFRAAAALRLGAEAWPAPALGLTPIERGTLVHATLDAFWRATETHAALVQMSEARMQSTVDKAFDDAKLALRTARWAALPPAIAAREGECVARLVMQWLSEVERMRAPFTVLHTERRATFEVAGYSMNVRLDRVDALESGGIAVTDYKTGWASAPVRWFAPRPQGMQLALYAQACEQSDLPAPVRALVYAQLRPGEIDAIGLAAHAQTWPGIATPTEVKGAALADWSDAMGKLQSSLGTLAQAFASGEAAIDPRNTTSVCKQCGLHALCRIPVMLDDATIGDGEDADVE
ncbi:MAG TPA: PD-(D/E)XK nuclease family protein [Casimicrobiaceae bacterium]|nr:PD-(D/E)XK nuclease family protein [Casimicrobiaceae bacterium]